MDIKKIACAMTMSLMAHNVSAAEFTTVTNGDVVDDLIMNADDVQSVKYGITNNTIINGGAIQTLYAEDADKYGVSNGAVLNGGSQRVAGGFANGTIINEGGELSVSSGASNGYASSGVANDSVINDGGVLIVSSNGVVNDTIVNGGLLTIGGSGTANNTTVDSGRVQIRSGGVADGLMEVSSSGEVIMTGGAYASDIVNNGGTLSIVRFYESDGDVAHVDKLTMNGGNISFLLGDHQDYLTMSISELSGSGNFMFNTSLADRISNFVTIEQGTGKFGVAVTDSGKEIADHTDLTVNLIHDQGGDIDFDMVTAKGRSTGAVDGGTYMYTLHSAQDKDGLTGGNVWYLAGVEKGADIDELQTTPATDAVLSLATAGLNVMRGELDSLRAYRNNQTTERKHGEGNVWGQYLGKKSLVDTSNGAAYTLNQSGVELGGDITTGFDSGNLVTGAFVTLTDNKVNHARGGKSRVDSYGLGAYATWYDNSGFYVDGALKANRLESNLNARMTNGGSTSGNWHQYGISSALEAGFTFKPSDAVSIEPFVRTTGTHINDANVTLSNGMKAQTGKARSLTAEAGTRLGTTFAVGKTQFAPYLHLGVEQELAKSNQTTINGVNRFDNNLNGTAGKYGVGVSAQLADNVALYGEMNYRQGSYIEEPMQGTAGIRIGF